MEEFLFPLTEISFQTNLHVNIRHHPPNLIGGNISTLIYSHENRKQGLTFVHLVPAKQLHKQ